MRVGDLSRELGLSPSRLRQLADAGEIPTTRTAGGHRLFDLGEVREAMARRAAPAATGPEPRTGPQWQELLRLSDLDEDRVWSRVARTLELDGTRNAGRIMRYAFTEMLNNAIDHAQGAVATVRWWSEDSRWAFEIADDGRGALLTLAQGLGLHSELDAAQQLSKGKRTTDPQHHPGEGTFFTSKAVDLFRLTSGGWRLTVDNLRHDTALGTTHPQPGTTIYCEIDPETTRTLQGVFQAFTEDVSFVRTRPAVKLFEIGTAFVSRSEARRILSGLAEDFQIVDVDFAGVTDVGQGFVDELLRVWPAAHPTKQVNPINMGPAVEFMVRRARRQGPGAMG